MKHTDNKSARRLEYFKNLYEGAKTAMADTVEGFERNIRQYNGSDEIDGSCERAGTVRNITYEIIESEIDYDVPVPKADSACFSERREKNARTVERLCSAIRDKLPFEEMNDIDERQTYIYGASVWYVEWDGSDVGSETGGIRVHCVSPLDFIPQPGIASVSDMEYCFLRFTTTKGELIRAYGVSEESLALAECEYEYEGSSVQDDTVTVVISFFIGDDGRVGKFVFSGDLTLLDIPSYYSRKIKVCKGCGGEADVCGCGGEYELRDIPFETVKRERLGGGAKGDARVPYYMPQRFPIVIRKNSSAMTSLYGPSDCDKIRPQQQAINKVESRILQKLLRAGITPVMPEDATVTLGNSVFGQVIKMRPGESLENYGKIDTTPDISQDVAEADRLYEQARRVLGITDALQGNDSYRMESGYARQLRISQATARLESKRRMKYLAYSEIYKLIFQHFLAFADEPRALSYKDGFGKIHMDEFNKYDFIEDTGYGNYRYFDEFLFSVDLNVGNEYKRETLWERNLSNLESGTLGDKNDPVTLLRYWQCQQRANYPYARENVEYFSDIVSKTEKKENQESEKNNES